MGLDFTLDLLPSARDYCQVLAKVRRYPYICAWSRIHGIHSPLTFVAYGFAASASIHECLRKPAARRRLS
jgi:hypothetical protein